MASDPKRNDGRERRSAKRLAASTGLLLQISLILLFLFDRGNAGFSIDQQAKEDGGDKASNINQVEQLVTQAAFGGARPSVSAVDQTRLYYDVEYVRDPVRAMSFWVDFSSGLVGTRSETLSTSYKWAEQKVLSFTFPFYGQPVKKVIMATGGFLYVGDQLNHWPFQTNDISPLMANFDLSTSDSSNIYYHDNGTSFTVQWSRVPLRGNKPPGEFSFQTTLNENGDIVFVYETLPISIYEIPEQEEHPVKVGFADAFTLDEGEFLYKKKFSTEYHRLNLSEGGQEIGSKTAIYIKALPTCHAYNSACDQCASAPAHLQCMWCPSIQRCSNGFDRRRQEWLKSKCDSVSKFECAANSPLAEQQPAIKPEVASSTSGSDDPAESNEIGDGPKDDDDDDHAGNKDTLGNNRQERDSTSSPSAVSSSISESTITSTLAQTSSSIPASPISAETPAATTTAGTTLANVAAAAASSLTTAAATTTSAPTTKAQAKVEVATTPASPEVEMISPVSALPTTVQVASAAPSQEESAASSETSVSVKSESLGAAAPTIITIADNAAAAAATKVSEPIVEPQTHSRLMFEPTLPKLESMDSIVGQTSAVPSSSSLVLASETTVAAAASTAGSELAPVAAPVSTNAPLPPEVGAKITIISEPTDVQMPTMQEPEVTRSQAPVPVQASSSSASCQCGPVLTLISSLAFTSLIALWIIGASIWETYADALRMPTYQSLSLID